MSLRLLKRLRPFPQRRLFWRIYVQGLLLIAVVAASAFTLVRWSANDQARSPLVGLQKFALATLPPNQPPDLSRIHKVLEADCALYDSQHNLITSLSNADPLPPLSTSEYQDLAAANSPTHYYRGGFHVAIALHGHRYLLLRWPNDRSPIWPIVGLAALLTLCALVMLPLARSISRPLEAIATTAHALGQGDLSARTHIQRGDEIGSLAASFDLMADRLQHLIHSEKELLANVSHELRTPLARLRVALTLLEDDAADSADSDAAPSHLIDHLPGIQEDVTQLQDLVDEILAAARLALAQGAAPSLPIQRQPLTLEDLIHRSAARFTQRHPHIPLDLPPLDTTEHTLDGDPNLLSRLLINLFENATKYACPTPACPITVRVAFDPLAQAVTLSVRDHGPGVPAALLPRLFDPFFRADPARSDVPGSGLGLTLCKRIAEAHGGSISASSPPDGGFIVSVSLPVSPLDP